MLKRSLPILAVLSLWHRYLWAKQSQSWSESEVQVLACLAYHIGTLAVHSLGQGQCGDEYPSKQVSKAASTPLHGIISMHCEHLQAMFVLEASQCNADLTSVYIYILPGNLQMHDLHPSFEAEWRGMRSSKGISWRLVLVLGVLYVLLRSSLPLAKCIRCIRQSCQIWYYNIITLRKTLSALSTLSALVIRSHRHQISS